MTKSINLSGQWIGHFSYGPEYGDEMQGETVQFRIFVNEFSGGQFKGTSVDTEGFGANMNTATISGFIIVDENGERISDPSNVKPRLSYEGRYDYRSERFSGQWELWANEELAGDGSIVDIFTGTWEMRKDD